MNEKIFSLDVFGNTVAAVSHFLKEEFPEGHRGWRLTGRRDGAEVTHAATCGNGFAFSYVQRGKELNIFYFENDIAAIKARSKENHPA